MTATLHAAPARHGHALLRSWIGVVTVAEFLGFAFPTAGALTVNAPAQVAVPAILAAGALEGAMLGAGQACVLRTALPGLPARRWVAATSAAAVLAYAIGLIPSSSVDACLAGGLLMAATTSILTGWALIRLPGLGTRV